MASLMSLTAAAVFMLQALTPFVAALPNDAVAKHLAFRLDTASRAVTGAPGSNFVPLSDEGTADPAFAPRDTSPLKARALYGGVDNRVLWNHAEYPYAAMGRIERSDGWVCSAALVGPRHVATARHCFLKWQGQLPATIKFQPNYFDTERRGHANVVTRIHIPLDGEVGGIGGSICTDRDDWAVGILDSRLGDTYGFLTPRAFVASELNQPSFYTLGYPGDLNSAAARMYRQEGISFINNTSTCDTANPLLLTTADAAGGQSGSPMWKLENNVRYHYGVISGGIFQGANYLGTYIAGGQAWVTAVAGARSNYP